MESIINFNIMIRPATPLMLLAEPPARQVRRTSVSGFDILFLITATLFVIGGCLFMLDLAAARSTGQESSSLQFVSHASTWLPGMAATIGKYALLLIASAVNSALIVLLVQALRSLDRKVSRITVRIRQGVSANASRSRQNREASALRDSSPFLLTPVFR